jgi:ribulose 1,5-bisphosphate carboxylase large subunit-like protein
MDENSAVVKIKVCSDLMDLKHCSFATLLSFIAGDVFGTSYDAEEIRVLDIDFSEKALAQFKGPKFGSEGIRKMLGLENSDRPLQALILKPNTGQPSSHYADIAYKAALGGMDFIKDDELNINPTSCPFEERVKMICDALKEAEKETGKKTIYAPNISFRPEYMKEYARKAIAAGASALMMNIVYVGMTAVQMIAEDPEFNVPIYVHRAGHDFFTRNEVGIAMPVMTKFFRLSGADIMSVGPVFGGLETKETVKKTYEAVNADMYGINKSLAVVSRSSKDIVQGTVDWLQTKNVMFLADGGIYNGPEGITATTKEMKETIEKVQIQSA